MDLSQKVPTLNLSETKDIKQPLVITDDQLLHKELKTISHRVNSLISDSERTPRVLSRCDAIVGNTQAILTGINELDAQLKDLSDNIKDIDEQVQELKEENSEIILALTRLTGELLQIKMILQD
jgi:hypothetical protein